MRHDEKYCKSLMYTALHEYHTHVSKGQSAIRLGCSNEKGLQGVRSLLDVVSSILHILMPLLVWTYHDFCHQR